jgi:hypothetical protein
MMTEAELQASIRKKCARLGLTVQHVENSLQGHVWVKGWPDLEIIGRAIIYRELKKQNEEPTPQQRRIGRVILAAGGDWGVWRPSDLRDGRIDAELHAIRRL